MSLIGQVINEGAAAVRFLCDALRSFIGRLLCVGYLLYWGLRGPFWSRLRFAAAVTLLGGAASLVLEIAAAMLNHLSFRRLVGLPWWAHAAILGAAVLMWRHRWHEMKSLTETQPAQLAVFRECLRETAALSFRAHDPEGNANKLDSYVGLILDAFRQAFRQSCQLNLMLQEDDGRLRIHYYTPDSAVYDPEFSLDAKKGEGGAGRAFKSGRTIYIPNVKFLHGVGVDIPGIHRGPTQPARVTYQFERNAYIPTRIEPYVSIVSVPIRTASGTVGVLNIDAGTSNAFQEQDFHVAEVAASLLAMALDRYRSGAEDSREEGEERR